MPCPTDETCKEVYDEANDVTGWQCRKGDVIQTTAVSCLSCCDRIAAILNYVIAYRSNVICATRYSVSCRGLRECWNIYEWKNGGKANFLVTAPDLKLDCVTTVTNANTVFLLGEQTLHIQALAIIKSQFYDSSPVTLVIGIIWVMQQSVNARSSLAINRIKEISAMKRSSTTSERTLFICEVNV